MENTPKRKVLYFTDSMVPYRTAFFNEMAKCCDLTVLYEFSANYTRNQKWLNSESINHKSIFLDKTNYRNKNIIRYFNALKILLGDYDDVILGCYNNPCQMFCIFMLRLLKKPYILNFDGEIFFEKGKFKTLVKKFFIRGANKYIIAGEKSKENLEKEMKSKNVFSYNFSSLTNEELKLNKEEAKSHARGNTVLVVGRYFGSKNYDYKGLSTAVKAAKLDNSINWKFIGTGNDTERFIADMNINESSNIEVIPFLQKEELKKEYCECGVLALPSIKECWGLVINEAASFGTPIVTSKGSGAGVDFLSNSPYEKYIFKTADADDLLNKIRVCLNSNKKEYSNFLIQKSTKYSIEEIVRQHMFMLEQ